MKSKSVLPISGRKTGELCRLLEERGKGDQQFQLLVENIDRLVFFLGQLEAGVEKPVKFQNDMTKKGWTVVGDVSDPESISVDALELIAFLKKGEQWISGGEMLARARELGTMLGQPHAEFLLDHQAEIPKEWQEHHIVFPGTVWHDPDGLLSVPSLYWRGGQWHFVFDWLGWGAEIRWSAVRLRNK